MSVIVGGEDSSDISEGGAYCPISQDFRDTGFYIITAPRDTRAISTLDC